MISGQDPFGARVGILTSYIYIFVLYHILMMIRMIRVAYHYHQLGDQRGVWHRMRLVSTPRDLTNLHYVQ